MSFCSAAHTSTLQHTNTHTHTRAYTCRDIIYLTAASVVPVFTNMPPPPAQLPLSLSLYPLLLSLSSTPCATLRSPAQSHFPFRFSRRCGFFVCMLCCCFYLLLQLLLLLLELQFYCVVVFALVVHWYSFCMPFVPRPCSNDAPICWQFPSICICGTSACALLKPFAALLYCFCTWNAYGLQLIEHSCRQENN